MAKELTAEEIKSVIHSMYDVAEVKTGYEYYVDNLLEKTIRIFKWNGLPKNLPQREIEKILLIFGYGGFLELENKLWFLNGALSGVTAYPDIFKYFTYANPTLKGGTKEIDKDVVICSNNSLRVPTLETVQRYARKLSDFDSSINIYTVNTRVQNFATATDDKVAKSVKNVYDKVKKGNFEVITDTPIFESFKPSPFFKGENGVLTDLIIAKESELKNFMREIGVKVANTKRERVISDEVEAENQMLMLNIDDMLQCRKDACKEVNEMFKGKYNISVELSNEFKHIEEVAYTQQSKKEKEEVAYTQPTEEGVENAD